MLLRKLHPVHSLPDYLKLELNADENASSGFLAALANIIDGMASLGEKQTISADPHLSDPSVQRNFLKLQGLITDSFGPEELPRLIDSVHSLQAEKGTLRSIVRLSTLYFGNVRVRRGRGVGRAHLNTPQKTLPLSESGDRDRVLLVRVEQESKPERTWDFLCSAKKFIPDGFDLIVSGNRRVVHRERIGMDVGSGFSLQGRKL